MVDRPVIDSGAGTRWGMAAGRAGRGRYLPDRTARPVPAGLLPAAVVLLLAVGGCSTGTGTDGARSTGASPPPASPAPTAIPPTPTPGAARPTTTAGGQGDARVVEVHVVGGQVQTPERRVRVPLGTMVELRVHADVSDEVHLHGYDRAVDVTPTRPAVLRFRADVPGVFEVELERAHRQLVQLQVQ